MHNSPSSTHCIDVIPALMSSPASTRQWLRLSTRIAPDGMAIGGNEPSEPMLREDRLDVGVVAPVESVFESIDVDLESAGELPDFDEFFERREEALDRSGNFI